MCSILRYAFSFCAVGLMRSYRFVQRFEVQRFEIFRASSRKAKATGDLQRCHIFGSLGRRICAILFHREFLEKWIFLLVFLLVVNKPRTS